MSQLLKIILSEKCIYDRIKLYEKFVHSTYDLSKKIPVIYKTDDDIRFREILDNKDIEYEVFENGFGVIYLYIDKLDFINFIINMVDFYIYFDFSYPIYFSDVNTNFSSCIVELEKSYDLTGEGVVIAFLDTGIDYTLNAFRNDDGSTRIRYLYNPTTNKEYSQDDINNALNSPNPFEKVNEVDISGHGTAVASIACAGGDIDKSLYGVAPKSEIICVNTITDIDTTQTLFHTVIKGLEFLSKKQKEEQLILVVNLSFSTNYGSHTGRSLLEEYVSRFATNYNTTVVVSAGNEGGVAHHKSGILSKDGEEVNFEIGGDYKSMPISLYKGILTDIAISINSPTKGSSQVVEIIEGTQIIKLGGNSVNIIFTGPTNYNVLGNIQIVINSDKNDFIERGIWSIKLVLLNEYESEYNMWLPISESIGIKTRFLNPNNNNTLGSPATVFNVISVGSYNYKTETVSIFSGRGKINDYWNMKPDILAPGEDVRAIFPGGRVNLVSGTSFSAPIVSGISALLMEWGIVKNNKEDLYGEVVKYFLIRGAKRIRNITYPNNSYGYGFVCASRSLAEIESSVSTSLFNRDDKVEIDTLYRKDRKCDEIVFESEEYISFLGKVKKGTVLEEDDGVCVYYLEKYCDEINAIVSIRIDELDSFAEKYFMNEDVVIEKARYYTICSESISPITDAGIYQTQNNEYLSLRGSGVIVGIVDTGIDYLNKEFMDELGGTRILEIWDQTITSDEEVDNDVLFGKVFKKEQIDEAIKAKNEGKDPYLIVPSKDELGHGTQMAGITSAAGYGIVKGGAPSSDIVVVKLKQISDKFKEYLDFSGDLPIYSEEAIYLAVEYLKNVKNKYNKPIVVLIPLQTNGGDHAGNTILGNQITRYSEEIGFVVVVPSGNQANKEIHSMGELNEIQKSSVIEVLVDKGQQKLNVSIYIEGFGESYISIISPSGEKTQEYRLEFNKIIEHKFLFEETKVTIITTISKNAIYIIKFVEFIMSDLKDGLWQIILNTKGNSKLRYSAYLPIKEFLKPETKFLNSRSVYTVTSPATARLAISMAYYNQNSVSIIAESGEGYTLDNRVSPILAAGGIDILTTGKNGSEVIVSGSSVAAAVATGGIALILEWGIIRKNETQLTSYVIIWLLISSANTPRGYEFPNKYWGYGILDIRNVFEILR